MYKQLITYNFSNDETRDLFEEMIENMEFEKQEDQSTYTLRARSGVFVREAVCFQRYSPIVVDRQY